MRRAYLTIDDSPGPRTDDLVDFLSARKVPAILFCRGDGMEQNMAPVVRAINKGFVIGSHGYHHKRASQLGYEAACASIDKADALIDEAYKQAGIARPARYYRFAYLDRGMGAWFVDPAHVPPEHKGAIENLIKNGLGNNPAQLPDEAGRALCENLQAHLRARGYTPVPFKGVTHPFYTQSGMDGAVDALVTCSTSDWAITARHKGKYGFETVADLNAALDADAHFAREDTAHIVLAHDQAEIHEAVCALVDHMRAHGVAFQEVV